MNIAISKPKLGKDSKAFLARKHHMLIGGKWVEARSGKTFEVEDPATQEIIAHVPAGDKADIYLAVTAARKAFETGPWSRISPAERSRLVWNLGDLLEKHADEFAEIEALDNGKPVSLAVWGLLWPSPAALPLPAAPRRCGPRLRAWAVPAPGQRPNWNKCTS